MRLWTLHPKYLDAKGLVALWREALLAQKVLQGATKGYRNHPQLLRFRETPIPASSLSSYLAVVHREAKRRGYAFDESKVGGRRLPGQILETKGQLLYELSHLKRKLHKRNRPLFAAYGRIAMPDSHPLFRIVKGGVRDWEKI